MKSHPWHAINAGGSPKTAFINGAFIVPMFANHESCKHWWGEYARKNKHATFPWAITDKPNNWPVEVK